MKIQGNLNLSSTSDVQICIDGKNYATLVGASANFKIPLVTAATAALITEQVNSTFTAITSLNAAIAGPISVNRLDLIKAARSVVDANLTALLRLVEVVANGTTVLEINRLGILHSAGMIERNTNKRQKQVFTAETGDIEGTVDLYAKGIARGLHEWRYAIDSSDPINWKSIDATLQANTVVSNLTTGQQYTFSHRTIEKDGPTEWESPKVARAK